MSAGVPLKEYLADHPDFVPGWRLTVNGVIMPPHTDWRVASEKPDGQGGIISYGSFVPMVTTGGNPYDRPCYQEAPYAQCVPWGRASDGMVRMGFVVQERRYADLPGAEHYGKKNAAIAFLTCVTGFKDVIGKKLESDLAAARRETADEVASAIILSEWVHPTGHIPLPPAMSTWGAATALEVDLTSLVEAGHDPSEPILGRHWLTVREWKDAVAAGEFLLADGRVAYVNYDVCAHTVQMFLCAHREIEREAFK